MKTIGISCMKKKNQHECVRGSSLIVTESQFAVDYIGHICEMIDAVLSGHKNPPMIFIFFTLESSQFGYTTGHTRLQFTQLSIATETE